MSKMADLEIEIIEMVEAGWTNDEIVSALRIPLAWVETVREYAEPMLDSEKEK